MTKKAEHREWESAEATAELLDAQDVRPDPLELGPVAVSSPWPVALRERWPWHTRLLAWRRLLPVPIISLQGRSFDVWLAGRSAHFTGGDPTRLAAVWAPGRSLSSGRFAIDLVRSAHVRGPAREKLGEHRKIEAAHARGEAE